MCVHYGFIFHCGILCTKLGDLECIIEVCVHVECIHHMETCIVSA